MNVKLIPATVQDIEQIQNLAFQIWNDHYPAIIGQQKVDYMLEKGYSVSSLEKQMTAGQQFFLVNDETEPIGFVSVELLNPNEMFINKFYIQTQIQRGGAGTRVLAQIIDFFPQIKAWRLQVNRQNHKAINFYFKSGFVIEKVADFNIGEGYFMNDFVMLKSS